MQLFDTYLINLDSSSSRLESTAKQLEAAQLEFTRISAVDGRGLDPNVYSNYSEVKALSDMGRKLSGGEMGCYLSHLKAAKAFLKTDKPYAMVLEDDISIASDLGITVSKIIHWLETNKVQWDLINMGDRKIKIHSPLQRFDALGEVHTLTRAHYFPMTTHGLLWSRAGARSFVDSEKLIYMPVDNYMREWLTMTNTGLAVWPRLVKTSGAVSVIDGQASMKRKATERSFFYGLIKQKRLWKNKFRAWRNKVSVK